MNERFRMTNCAERETVYGPVGRRDTTAQWQLMLRSLSKQRRFQVFQVYIHPSTGIPPGSWNMQRLQFTCCCCRSL